jgi:hypothetical protein
MLYRFSRYIATGSLEYYDLYLYFLETVLGDEIFLQLLKSRLT